MVLFDMTIEILAVVRLAKTEENAYNLVTVTSEAVTMKSERREKNSTIGIGERWRLQDAKARFSEVVKRAREHGPELHQVRNMT